MIVVRLLERCGRNTFAIVLGKAKDLHDGRKQIERRTAIQTQTGLSILEENRTMGVICIPYTEVLLKMLFLVFGLAFNTIFIYYILHGR